MPGAWYKKTLRLQISIAIVVFVPALAFGQPDWVTNLGESAQHPSSAYLTGFGESQKSQEIADDRARADLSKGIKTTVYTEIEDRLSDEVSKTSVFTRCVSDLTLEGVSIKRHREGGRYYALAVLNRSEADNLLRSKIEDHDASAKAYYVQAQGYETDGVYGLALRNYFLAEEARTNAMSLEMIRRVVRVDRAEERELSPAIPELESRVERIVSRMQLSPVSGEGQSIGYGVEPAPVCARLTVGEEEPVAGIAVTFSIESGTGSVEDAVATDQRGRACTPVYDPRSDVKNRLVVRAKVAPDALGDQIENTYSRAWMDRMRACTCVFTFRFEETSSEEFRSLDEVFRWFAYELNRHATRSQSILVGSLTYRTTGTGGEFAKYVQDGLSTSMTVAGMNVARAEEVQYAMRSVRTRGLRGYAEPALAESHAKQMGKDLTLTGTYWDHGDRTEIAVRLAPSSGSGPVVTKRVAFSSELMPPDMSLKPDNFGQAQRVEKVFEQDRPISSGFDVKLWLDRPEGSTYVEDEKMVVYFVSNRDCYIRLIYHDAYGDNYEIFPNGCDQDNFVRANMVKSIGNPESAIAFVVSGPPFGVERLWVHASTARLSQLPGEPVGGECTFLKLTDSTEEIVSMTRGVPNIVKRPSGAGGSVLKAEDSVTITTVPRR